MKKFPRAMADMPEALRPAMAAAVQDVLTG